MLSRVSRHFELRRLRESETGSFWRVELRLRERILARKSDYWRTVRAKGELQEFFKSLHSSSSGYMEQCCLYSRDTLLLSISGTGE